MGRGEGKKAKGGGTAGLRLGREKGSLCRLASLPSAEKGVCEAERLLFAGLPLLLVPFGTAVSAEWC